MTRTGSTQRDNIKKHLKDGYSLTALEALSLFGAYRLAAHIHVLREKHGMPIIKTMNKDVTGRTYARYKLAPESVAPTIPQIYYKRAGDEMQRLFDNLMVKALSKGVAHHA